MSAFASPKTFFFSALCQPWFFELWVPSNEHDGPRIDHAQFFNFQTSVRKTTNLASRVTIKISLLQWIIRNTFALALEEERTNSLDSAKKCFGFFKTNASALHTESWLSNGLSLLFLCLLYLNKFVARWNTIVHYIFIINSKEISSMSMAGKFKEIKRTVYNIHKTFFQQIFYNEITNFLRKEIFITGSLLQQSCMKLSTSDSGRFFILYQCAKIIFGNNIRDESGRPNPSLIVMSVHLKKSTDTLTENV